MLAKSLCLLDDPNIIILLLVVIVLFFFKMDLLLTYKEASSKIWFCSEWEMMLNWVSCHLLFVFEDAWRLLTVYKSLCLLSSLYVCYVSLHLNLSLSLCLSCVCGMLACPPCWLVFCTNLKGPNRKILLDMLCSVGVQRCLPRSPSSPPPLPPPPVSNKTKPRAIGNASTQEPEKTHLFQEL